MGSLLKRVRGRRGHRVSINIEETRVRPSPFLPSYLFVCWLDGWMVGCFPTQRRGVYAHLVNKTRHENEMQKG